ncbi:electron transport protein [Citrobacter koseri]|nr:electron transport protein [Citrobacter koseri]
MGGMKRTRWQRRPGTIGGKLPWNDWRNASTWRRATQFLLLLINIYIGITFYFLDPVLRNCRRQRLCPQTRWY